MRLLESWYLFETAFEWLLNTGVGERDNTTLYDVHYLFHLLRLLKACTSSYWCIVVMFFKQGNCWIKVRWRVRGHHMCPLYCSFSSGADISILRAPMAAAISPFMSSLNPPNSWWVMMSVTKKDQTTGNYIPYPFEIVCGFFNIPQSFIWTLFSDGTYGLSSLSEKTRKSKSFADVTSKTAKTV